MSDCRYGYVDALKQAGLYRPELVCEVNFATLQQDVSSAIAYLKAQQADGLFAVAIRISLAAIRALHPQGVKIQEDLRLVCFDKSEVFDFMPHPLPYILQPVETMARKAVDFLPEQRVDGQRLPQTSKFSGTLVANK